ncbi:tRNA (adenosine(37)-N6)-dimethylallyltransferase MiaA [Alteromonas sediminis]|uniref:tRNA dimethylallyltransferase n=1 Tax=Alteromonas sediminis TaxID=2259342 RepID=A0A3N5XZ19_9ALTE|nr:tRNA (adenosine(37)-N6)-dimethylallyltransferase MiaA [Alteromonas sediminis]RPJ65256.1 tRNA (adenosine(37)-N6)-dimethylallyltransferase MiaA [Alteromonas sediminis]
MKKTLPVVALMGPTASGKTGLAIELAKHLDGEVVSVDSALIYRGMDIGTAKPTEEERDGVPHWLIDTHDPSESYSVSAFFDDAIAKVSEIQDRGKVPLLTGGTMMYFNALVNGIAALPAANQAIREQIEAEAVELGWQALHTRLSEIDPICAEKIHPNDPQRLIRALEVYLSSGKPLSWWQAQPHRKAPFEMIQFAIAPIERSDLHARIAQRFDIMLDNNFVEEVEKLHARPQLHVDLPAIRSVGYRQVWEYLDGVVDYSTMREKGIIATRQLAKRQITWLRGWKSLFWLDTFADDNLKKMLGKITP